MIYHNIAITGANGYIGQSLVNYFSNQHKNVYSMMRKTQSSLAEFISFELGGKKNDYSKLQEIDVLIHCAYDFSLTKKQEIEKVNIEGSLELFAAAREFGVKQIIYLSTTSAFPGALSFYGQAKYQLEIAAKAYDVIIVRPGLVFSKNAGGIVGTLNKLVQKLPLVPIIGKGEQTFYPCHVNDLAELINYLIKNPIINQPIIAANNETISFKQILHTLASIHEKKIMLLPIPYHCIYFGLKTIELIGLKLGMRSDSLKYLRQHIQPDFNLTNHTGIRFNAFNVETLLRS